MAVIQNSKANAEWKKKQMQERARLQQLVASGKTASGRSISDTTKLTSSAKYGYEDFVKQKNSVMSDSGANVEKAASGVLKARKYAWSARQYITQNSAKLDEKEGEGSSAKKIAYLDSSLAELDEYKKRLLQNDIKSQQEDASRLYAQQKTRQGAIAAAAEETREKAVQGAQDQYYDAKAAQDERQNGTQADLEYIRKRLEQDKNPSLLTRTATAASEIFNAPASGALPYGSAIMKALAPKERTLRDAAEASIKPERVSEVNPTMPETAANLQRRSSEEMRLDSLRRLQGAQREDQEQAQQRYAEAKATQDERNQARVQPSFPASLQARQQQANESMRLDSLRRLQAAQTPTPQTPSVSDQKTRMDLYAQQNPELAAQIQAQAQAAKREGNSDIYLQSGTAEDQAALKQDTTQKTFVQSAMDNASALQQEKWAAAKAPVSAAQTVAQIAAGNPVVDKAKSAVDKAVSQAATDTFDFVKNSASVMGESAFDLSIGALLGTTWQQVREENNGKEGVGVLNTLKSMFLSAGGQFNDSVLGMLSNIAELVQTGQRLLGGSGGRNYYKELRAMNAETLNKAISPVLENGTWLENLAMNVGSMALNSFAMMKVGSALSGKTIQAMGGGLGTVNTALREGQIAFAGNVAQMSPFAIQSATENYDQARADGKTPEQAAASGILAGLMSLATNSAAYEEYSARMGLGVASSAQMLGGVSSTYMAANWGIAAFDWLKNALGTMGVAEGLQEVSESFAIKLNNDMWNGTVFNTDKWQEWAQSAKQEFAYGYLSGALFYTSALPAYAPSRQALGSMIEGNTETTPAAIGEYIAQVAEDVDQEKPNVEGALQDINKAETIANKVSSGETLETARREATQEQIDEAVQEEQTQELRDSTGYDADTFDQLNRTGKTLGSEAALRAYVRNYDQNTGLTPQEYGIAYMDVYGRARKGETMDAATKGTPLDSMASAAAYNAGSSQGSQQATKSQTEATAPDSAPATYALAGRAAQNITEAGAQDVTVSGVNSVEDGTVYLTAKDASGEEGVYDISDIDFGDDDMNSLASVTDFTGMNKADVKQYFTAYNGDIASPAQYARAYQVVARQAASGASYERATAGLSAQNYLTPTAMRAAYNSRKSNAPAKTASSKSAENKLFSREYSQEAFDKIGDDKAKKQAEGELSALEAVAKKYNTRIRIVDSIDVKGKNGKVRKSAANGYYNSKTGEITIALDATENAYLYVGMHELSHAIQQKDADLWDDLVGYVAMALKKNGQDIDAMVRREKERLGLNTEDAIEEVICNAIPSVLQDEQNVNDLLARNPDLFTTIKNWINEFINNLKSIGDRLGKHAGWESLDALKNDTESLREIYRMISNAPKENGVSSEQGTRYSLKSDMDSEGNVLSSQQQQYFKDVSPLLRGENGGIKPFYHGTGRSDRVGTIFDPARATSGPMAFFTDSKEIADSYSRSKADTSIAYDSEYDSYETQFRAEKKDGSSVAIGKAWARIPYQQQVELRRKAAEITTDDDGNIVSEEGNTKGSGNFDYNLKRFGGNAINALIEEWLNSGNLFNEEASFMEVLDKSGITETLKKAGYTNTVYKDPNARYEKVYKAYLNITNPFDTTTVDKSFADAMERAAKKVKYNPANNASADMWDKNSHDPSVFIERLRDDIKNGTSYAWTSIPDYAADFLKSKGYDGIVDTGGKMGGMEHLVAIPFRSNQIKDTANTNPTENADIRYSINDQNREQIVQNNAEIEASTDAEMKRQLSENLSGMVKATEGHRITQTDADILAKTVLTEARSGYDRDSFSKEITDIFNYAENNGDIGELQAAEYDLAKKVIAESSSIVTEHEERSKEAREYLRKTPIKLTNAQWAEAVSMAGSSGAFRKALFGRARISQNANITLDQAWAELSRMNPEYFSPDANETDMPAILLDAVDALQPVYENPFGFNVEEGAAYIAMRMNEAYMDLQSVKQAAKDKKAFGDAASQYGKARAAFAEQSKAAFNSALSRIHKSETKSGKAVAAAAKQETKAKYEDRLQAMRIKYAQSRTANVESRRATELRNKIKAIGLDLSARISHPTDGKYVPVKLIQSVQQACDSVLSAWGSANDTKVGQRITALRAELDAMKRAQDADYASEDFNGLANMAQALADEIGEKTLREMNLAQITRVYKLLRGVQASVQNAKKLIGVEQAITTYRAAEQTISEIRAAKGFSDTPLGRFQDLFTESLLGGIRFFRRLTGYAQGSTMVKLAEDINDGQRKSIDIRRRGESIFREFVDTKEKLKWMQDFQGRKAKLVDVGLTDERGKPIKVTRAMVVSLYLHSLNADNMKHIEYGGIVVPEWGAYKRGDIKQAYANGTKVVPAVDDIARIVKTLTPRERAIAEKLYYFFNSFSKKYINDTSLELNGFTKADVMDYFPIRTDSNYLASNFEGAYGYESIINPGWLIERKQASQPIYLEDAISVMERQLDAVSKYAGLAVPIRNFNKVWNTSMVGYADSVKSAVASKWGTRGQKYVENLFADLQGARNTGESPMGRMFNTLKGNFAQATLAMNISVSMKQAASYPTAASEVGWAPLAKALVRGGKNNLPISRADQALIEKYTPLLWYRSKGMINTEVGDAVKDRGLARKMPKLFGWIEKVDVATVGRLWYAAQYYVKQEHPRLEDGTDAFYQETARVFNRIVENTQPNYTTMQRPDLLRNPNALVRSTTMFMTQRLQNFGIVYDAFADYSSARKGNDSAHMKAAGRNLRLAVTSQAVSAATIGVMTFLARAALGNVGKYRDDDKELTPESVTTQIAMDAIAAAIGMIPGGSELYSWITSTIEGKTPYDIDVPGISQINDFAQDISLMYKNINEGKGDSAILSSGKKVTYDAATLLGLPLKNFNNLWDGAMAAAADISNGTFGTWESSKEYVAQDLMNAVLNGAGSDKINQIKEKLIDSSRAKDPETSVNQNTRNLLKDEYIRLCETDTARADKLGATIIAEFGGSKEMLSKWVKDAHLDSLKEAVENGDLSGAKAALKKRRADGYEDGDTYTSLKNLAISAMEQSLADGDNSKLSSVRRTLVSLGLKNSDGENYFTDESIDALVTPKEDKKKEAGVTDAVYFAYENAKGKANADGQFTKDDLISVLDNLKATDAQKVYLYTEENPNATITSNPYTSLTDLNNYILTADPEKVKTSITNAYKDLIISAYVRGDNATVARYSGKLFALNLYDKKGYPYYKQATIDGWINDYLEKQNP